MFLSAPAFRQGVNDKYTENFSSSKAFLAFCALFGRFFASPPERLPPNENRETPLRGAFPCNSQPRARYSSTNFVCTLYSRRMVLNSSGSSSATASTAPAAFALRISTALSYITGMTLLFES